MPKAIKKRHAFKSIVLWTVCPIVLFILISTAFLLFILEPSVSIPMYKKLDINLLNTTNQCNYSVLANDNREIQELTKKINVEYNALQKHTINAFLAAEDHKFFGHKGVDNIRIAKAAITNITHRRYKEGASTITQQLIKNTHLDSKKTIHRKINEIRLAKDLEKKYSKERILEIYFNVIYFGNGLYGLGTASKVYFGINASDLNIAQSAFLAGIINNPNKYNPYTNIENTNKRKNLIISQMKKFGFIDEKEKDDAMRYNISIIKNDNIYKQISYYIDKVLENCILDKTASNIVVRTSIDTDIMKHSCNIISKAKPENIDIAFVIIDNKTSQIVAMNSTSAYDMSNTKRQPASTIKPILCYAPAYEKNIITPITKLIDEKQSFGDWSPKNVNDKYYGKVTANTALSKSLNIPAINLLKETGIDYSKNFAKKLGIEFDEKDNNFAIALGGTTNGLTLIDIVNAYKTFANMGNYKNSSIVKQVEKNGDLLYKNKARSYNAMRDDTATLINMALKDCTTIGTAKKLKNDNYEICAKTGTAGNESGNTDAYCIAYTSNHTVGVWFGGKNMPNNITGGNQPTSIVKMIFDFMYKNNLPKSIPRSKKIVAKYVDLDCYQKENKIFEASKLTKPNEKFKAYFSIYNLPKKLNKKTDYQKILDNQLWYNNYFFKYYDNKKKNDNDKKDNIKKLELKNKSIQKHNIKYKQKRYLL